MKKYEVSIWFGVLFKGKFEGPPSHVFIVESDKTDLDEIGRDTLYKNFPKGYPKTHCIETKEVKEEVDNLGKLEVLKFSAVSIHYIFEKMREIYKELNRKYLPGMGSDKLFEEYFPPSLVKRFSYPTLVTPKDLNISISIVGQTISISFYGYVDGKRIDIENIKQSKNSPYSSKQSPIASYLNKYFYELERCTEKYYDKLDLSNKRKKQQLINSILSE